MATLSLIPHCTPELAPTKALTTQIVENGFWDQCEMYITAAFIHTMTLALVVLVPSLMFKVCLGIGGLIASCLVWRKYNGAQQRALCAQIKEFAEENTKLKETIEQLESSVTLLTTEVTKLHGINEQLQHNVEGLTTQTTELAQQKKELCQQIEELKDNNVTLATSINELKEENSSLQDVAAQLQKTSETLLCTKEALENKVADLTTQLSAVAPQVRKEVERLAEWVPTLLESIQKAVRDVQEEGHQKAEALLKQVEEAQNAMDSLHELNRALQAHAIQLQHTQETWKEETAQVKTLLQTLVDTPPYLLQLIHTATEQISGVARQSEQALHITEEKLRDADAQLSQTQCKLEKTTAELQAVTMQLQAASSKLCNDVVNEAMHRRDLKEVKPQQTLGPVRA